MTDHPTRDTLADAAEGLLAPAEAAVVDAHLAGCADCRAETAAFAEVGTVLASVPAPTMPADVVRRLAGVVAAEQAAREVSPVLRAVPGSGPDAPPVPRHPYGTRRRLNPSLGTFGEDLRRVSPGRRWGLPVLAAAAAGWVVGLARGAVVGAAVGVAATAAVSAVATTFARAVVSPTRRRPSDTEVLAVRPGTGPGVPGEVVLRATPDTVVPGRYGLWSADGTGYARLGAITARDESAATVTREVLGVDSGVLVPGPARWSGWFHAGTPRSALGLEHEDVVVRSPVGDLPAWFVPAPAGATGRTWAVLVHGRGATREECLRALPLLHRLGLPALVPTYRNDGDAPASPTGRYGLGETEWPDVEAAVAHALAHGAREVVLVGWSMGGAIVLQLLARSWTASNVRAVVLDGPVVDWRSVLDHQAHLNQVPRGVGRYGVSILGSPLARRLVGVDGPVDLRRSDWVHRADELRVPVLVLHSEDDEFVPVAPSRRLADRRPDLVTFVPFTGARHCKEWNVDPERWEREVARFLLDHL